MDIKTRHLSYQAFLHVQGFAMLGMGSISLCGYLLAETPNAFSLVLLPDSALAVLLLGLGLLGCANRRNQLCQLFAGLVLGIGLYSLSHNLLLTDSQQGRSLISGFLRIRSPTALLFCLLALGLLSSQLGTWGKRLSVGLGLMVIGLAGLSQLAPTVTALSAWRLGFNHDVNNLANLFSLSMGLALFCLNRLPAEREHLLDRRTLLAGALGTLLTCSSWYLLGLQNIEASQRHSTLLLSELSGAIERTFSAHLLSIQRMAERWRMDGRLPSPAKWQQESSGYLRDFPDITLTALLDEQLRPQRLFSRSLAETDWLQHLLSQPRQRDWLRRAAPAWQSRLSPALNLDARHNSLIAIPLNLPANPSWTLVASLNLTRTLKDVLGAQPQGFSMRLYENQQLLFDSAPQQPMASLNQVGQQLLHTPGSKTWRLVSYQNLDAATQASSLLPSLVMLFGLTFSFFIMLSQRLGRLAIEHSRHLHLVNRALEASLHHQDNLQALNQRIMDFSMDLLCSIDENGHFTQVSPSSVSVLGYQPDELIGRPYLNYVVPEDRQTTQATVQAMMAGEEHQDFRNSYQRKDGSIVQLLWSGGWSENDRTLFAVAHDITRLVQNEAYAEDQRDILGMISTDQPLADTLKVICQVTEVQLPGTYCSVLLMDKEQQHLLLGAAPNLPHSYSQALHGMKVGAAASACSTAVQRRQLVISNDIDGDPLWQDYRALALGHGLQACWSIPLISHQGDVLGTFAIYHHEPKQPDDEQLQLIGTAGQLAAIAIERQHDRLRLQVSEQRYRSLFTFNPDPVFSFDLDGQIESLNQAGCQLCGYSEQELLGQPMSLLLHNDELEEFRNHLKAAREGGTQRYAIRCKHRDGHLLELDLTTLPIITNEQIVGVFSIAKDISERNRMTRALREALQHSERQAELLRGMTDTAVNINSLVDSQPLLDYLSERLRLLIGSHQASVSLIRSTDSQIIHALSLSEKYAGWQECNRPIDDSTIRALVRNTEQPVLLGQAELESHSHWREQAELNVNLPPMRGWLAVPMKDYAGNNLGLLQLSEKNTGEFDQDDLAITQQFAQMAVAVLENNRLMRTVITGEQRLKTQLDFTSAITNSIAEGLLAIDGEGHLNFINPAAAALLGQPVSTLLGQPLVQHLPLPLEQTQGRGSHHGELRLPQGAQSERYIAYDSAPLLDDDGPQGWVVAFRDITAHKEADKQLRLLQRSLEASFNGALICDAQADDMPIIYVNPAFERITGYSAAEALGRNCRFLQGEAREQPGIGEIHRGLALQQDVHVVLRNFRKDGTPFWNALYIAPVPNELGEVTHFIGVQNDISEQKRFESELAYNASHDVLTGLPNRSLLEDRLSQGCRISNRYKRNLAVMFIDLDGFKPINDTLGHIVGDQILVEVARRLNLQIRPGDTVARLGGDEFIVILPDLAREEDVLLVSDRIVESLARPYQLTHVEQHITASIGITLSDGNIEQPMQLIQQADLAMYKAKQQGRNNYQWYTEDLNQKVSERVTLRNELQKAIETEAFQLYYQPQIDGRSGRVVGYEALLRWHHAERGFIPPAQFIPVAEDTGQIIPLSEWVLNTACRAARSLADQGFNGAVMAVNVSPVQFQRANFVEQVRSTLEQTLLPAELLELEITETVLLDNAEKAICTLHALKELGVRISIDDFGTGFSSLNYLKRLPIDKVKIDRSFVQEVISDRHDSAITQGIISMAHHLKLKVLAEGVETEPQLAFLKKSRCDEFQGYYFAKPMPLPQLEGFLHQQHEELNAQQQSRTSDSHAQTLLLLDDEENILRALTRVLRRDGYQIITASRAQDAFALLAKHDVQVILSDQRMPEMNGTEFFSRVKSLHPETIRIVLSGYTDLKSVTDAINQGAIYKFLTKPWDDEHLRTSIAQAFQHHSLAMEKDGNARPADEEQT
jgi:diguanylate cyclase (GGDEF)-like protein/PAS domain S-box-containing protein